MPADSHFIVLNYCVGTVFEHDYSQNRSQLEFESQNVAKRYGASVVAYRVQDHAAISARQARHASKVKRVPLRAALEAFQWVIRRQTEEVCSTLFSESATALRTELHYTQPRRTSSNTADTLRGLILNLVGRLWFAFLSTHQDKGTQEAEMRSWFSDRTSAQRARTESIDVYIKNENDEDEEEAEGHTSVASLEHDGTPQTEPDNKSKEGGSKPADCDPKQKPRESEQLPFTMNLSLAFVYVAMRWYHLPVAAVSLLNWVRRGRITLLRKAFDMLPEVLRNDLDGTPVRKFFWITDDRLLSPSALILLAERLVAWAGAALHSSPMHGVPTARSVLLPICNLQPSLMNLVTRWMHCNTLLMATLSSSCERVRVRQAVVPLSLAVFDVLQQRSPGRQPSDAADDREVDAEPSWTPAAGSKAANGRLLRVFGRVTTDCGEALVAIAAFTLLLLLGTVPFVRCRHCSKSLGGARDKSGHAHAAKIADCAGLDLSTVSVEHARARSEYNSRSMSDEPSKQFFAVCSSSLLGVGSSR